MLELMYHKVKFCQARSRFLPQAWGTCHDNLGQHLSLGKFSSTKTALSLYGI
jgi:hypothetical protein